MKTFALILCVFNIFAALFQVLVASLGEPTPLNYVFIPINGVLGIWMWYEYKIY